jgi:N-acyl-D-aspartate/D-glutamate deacylase
MVRHRARIQIMAQANREGKEWAKVRIGAAIIQQNQRQGRPIQFRLKQTTRSVQFIARRLRERMEMTAGATRIAAKGAAETMAGIATMRQSLSPQQSSRMLRVDGTQAIRIRPSRQHSPTPPANPTQVPSM